ncbi:hypothetical protein KP806_22640 [Paenibacillus sp. N4]|uniref:hypothetical protein n=1 Tax=Paenibacillus vietnamensis TaxID=2590547 RepID=UPI001CD112A6|nr:hypothetical protein [Paenibacillus vietnamensis]MCA0757863.1 hypothetical protein [Paenibacillus vietnamensis]
MNDASNGEAAKRRGGKLQAVCRLAALLPLLFLTAGCRYTAAPADLLQKPKIAPDKQAIVKAIEETLPAYSKLTLPLREDHMEAVRLIDVDSDGEKEAIVSYYNEYNTPELMLFNYTSGTWTPWVLIQQPLARQIAWLKLEDLDLDGELELILGWVGGFDSPNMLEIYSFGTTPVRNDAGKLALKPSVSMPYSYAETGQLNLDGKPELAVVTESIANQEVALPDFYLTTYSWEKGSLKQLNEVKLQDGVNHYDRLLIGRISPRHHGLILEASTGAHATYTAMYAWESGRLRLIYPAEGDKRNGVSGRPVMSGDQNNDGILELQWTREAPGYGNVPYSDSKWIDEWMQWDGKESFDKIREEFSDYRYGIQLRIPESWFGRYTLRNPVRDAYAVVAIDYWNAGSRYTSELAALYAVPVQQWEEIQERWKDKSRSYRRLLTDSGNVIAISYAEQAPDGWPAYERQAFGEMLEARDELASGLRIRHDF